MFPNLRIGASDGYINGHSQTLVDHLTSELYSIHHKFGHNYYNTYYLYREMGMFRLIYNTDNLRMALPTIIRLVPIYKP